MRAKGALRFDDIARAVLMQPGAPGIVSGSPPRHQQLQTVLWLAYRGQRLADLIFARLQPVPEVMDQVLKEDLSIELTLHSVGDALQEGVAQALLPGWV